MDGLLKSLLRHHLTMLCTLLTTQSVVAEPAAFDVPSFNQQLKQRVAQQPEWLSIHRLGRSTGGYPIYVVKAQGSLDQPEKPELHVFINGAHHGDEPITATASLAFLDHLILERQSNDQGFYWRDLSIHIQPIVNPDGLSRGSRYDLEGNDPNRVYPQLNTNTPQRSWVTNEIRHVMRYMERYPFAGAIALHSGSTAVLWPWGFTHKPHPEAAVLRQLAKASAHAMGIERFLQSHHDYYTTGEFIDWAYQQHSTHALTFEIGPMRVPIDPSKAKIWHERTVAGIKAYLLTLRQQRLLGV